MIVWIEHRRRWSLLHIYVAAVAALACGDVRAQWTQYGGPNQSFTVEDPAIAKEWPPEGPRRIWTRKLGEGYSAILAHEGRLYTMYRSGDNEVVIGLDARTGETLWEYVYVSVPPKGHFAEYGRGPNATPLLTDGRLYAIGVAGIMHCLEPATGKLLWSHDLLGEFGGTVLGMGYSSSPIEYKDTVIVLVGGKGQSIVAFDKRDGHVVWKNLDFENSYSTPRIMKIGGEDQLVAFMGTEVIGADPNTGALKWQYPIRNEYKQNITMPTLLDGDLLFISTWRGGSRGLKLVKGDPFRVDELWSTLKVQSFFESSVRMGDYIYGSSDSDAAYRLCAINARTGKIGWRVRDFVSANIVAVGNRLLILEENGHLTLATPSPEGVSVHSKVKVLDSPARTAPTILGTVLYLRDQRSIAAVGLN